MAPNKLEDTIKKTLEKRQIQPTSNAWNQLSNSLDKQDKKRSYKYAWIIGVAASFVGILILVNTFQSSQSIENIITPTIVSTTSENKSETDTVDDIATETTAVENIIDAKNGKNPTPNSNKNKVVNTKENSKIQVATVARNKIAQASQNSAQAVQNNIPEEQELNRTSAKKTIAQNKEKFSNPDATLNSEVEALMKVAKSNISSTATLEESNYNINANSLLQDVEVDLEKSFRDKVFETLKTNFKIVKTAVADRNN